MFGLSIEKLALLAVIAGIFLGPDKLPQAARSCARLYRGLRDVRTSARQEAGTLIDDLKKAVDSTAASSSSGTRAPESAPEESAPPRHPQDTEVVE